MKPILRADTRAVSPVIATILLVAITVVLAAVLYIMVSGLFSPQATAQFIGVNLTRSSSGTEWVLTFTTVPSAVTQNETSLAMTAANGTPAMAAKTLFQLEGASGGVEYLPAHYGPATIAVGDDILIPVASFPSGTHYQLSTSARILAVGNL